MADLVEMLGGVTARRTIAAANVTAGETKAKMNPGRAPLQALFTADRARGDWLQTDHMRTRHFVPPGMKTPPMSESETAWPIQVGGDFAKTTPTPVGPGPRKSTGSWPKRRAAKRSRAHEQARAYRRRSRSRRRIARRSPFRSFDIEVAICNAGTRSGLTTSPRRRAKPRYPFRSSDSASRRPWTLPRCERRPRFNETTTSIRPSTLLSAWLR